jgi:hypothetical protein
MQLQLDVNDYKANILFEFLDIFKKDDLISDYVIIDKTFNSYEKDLLSDLQDFDTTLKKAKDGVGTTTDKVIVIKDL